MQTVTTIGLDIAKSVFQVHGVDAGQVVIRRQLKRRYILAFFQKLPPCLVGIEACASSRERASERSFFALPQLSSLRTTSAPSTIARIFANAISRGMYLRPQSGATTILFASTYGSARRMR